MKNQKAAYEGLAVILVIAGVVMLVMAGIESLWSFVYVLCIVCGWYVWKEGSDMIQVEMGQRSVDAYRNGRNFRSIVMAAVLFVYANIRSLVLAGNSYLDAAGQLKWPVVGIIAACGIYAVMDEDGHKKPVKVPETVYYNKEKRRYTMLVEQSSLHETASLMGTVHGLMKAGDEVDVLLAGRSPVHVRVIGLKVNGASVQQAKDCHVEVKLDAAIVVEQFSVLSSLQAENRPLAKLENPLLRGMCYEYGRYIKDHHFMSLFLNALVHSSFVVPVMMDHLPQLVNGRMQFVENTRLGFMGVSRKDGGGAESFAIFTDEDALTRWKQLYLAGNQPKTLRVTFQDAVSIMWKGHQSMVINPFGPVYVFLTGELVDAITRQDSYIKEFGAPGEHGLSFVNQEDEHEHK